jgi:hypothetical protein
MRDKQKNPEGYIGDGVYVEYDGFGIILRANDPNFPSDTIYLEPNVITDLNTFYDRVKPRNSHDK